MAKTKKTTSTKKPSAKKSLAKKDADIKLDRRTSSSRRGSDDRRQKQEEAATEQRATPRRKVQRRRQIDPTTCERDYTEPEIQFMNAMEDYKRSSGRMFPTCSEILEVVQKMGYVQLTPEELAARQPIEPAPENFEAEAIEEETL